MLDIGQQMDRMRKDGALFHYSRGGRHTNSQTILVFQPITLIWALARTNLINCPPLPSKSIKTTNQT